MSNGMRKTTYREIKGSFGRYMAIFAIVMLGVGLFAGLKATTPAMIATENTYLYRQNFFDFRLLSTIGFEPEDAGKLETAKEVGQAEGAVSVDALCTFGDGNESVYKFHTLPEKINLPIVTSGRLPEHADECVLDDAAFGEDAIGSRITVTENNAEDTLEMFGTRTFTVVGTVRSPYYINFERGTTSIGDGKITAFLYVPKASFVCDYLTEIYVTLAEKYDVYTEEYDTYIEDSEEEMERWAERLACGRYDRITAEAQKKIEDAQAQLDEKAAEAEAELQDAWQEILDGEQELADGEQEILDGEREIRDGRKEIADYEQEILDGERELADGEKEIQDREKEAADAEEEIRMHEWEIFDGEQKLAMGREELEQAKGLLREKEALLRETEAELTEKEAELMKQESRLTAQDEALAAEEAGLAEKEQTLAAQEGILAVREEELAVQETALAAQEEELAMQEAALTEQEAGLAAQEAELTLQEEKLEAQGAELTARETELNGQAAERNSELEQLEQAFAMQHISQEQYEEGKQRIQAGLAQIQAALGEVQAAKAQAEEGKVQLQAGKEQIQAAKAQLQEGRARIQEGKNQLEEGKARLQAGKNQLEEGKAQLQAAKMQREDGKQHLQEGRARIQEGLGQVRSGLSRIEAGKGELQAGKDTIQEAWNKIFYNEDVLQAAEGELIPGKREVTKARTELEDGKAELAKARTELEEGKQDLEEGREELAKARAELADASEKLEDGRREWADGKTELEDAKTEYRDAKAEFEEEVTDARRKIQDAREELADLEEPESYALTRNTNIGYACYESDSNIVAAIANVFPLFFFLVAALICMTTMNRMVEEQRTQIGVLKALGYGNGAIMGKYLFYAGSAAAAGAVIGCLGGTWLFPKVIWMGYGIMYSMGEIEYFLDARLAVLALAAALFCSMGAAWLSCRYELYSVPANLIRPKAPKSGKRIFLERVTFIWGRMKFLHKVSVRNIIRYKKRFFMMILGISGCTALLVTGFGLKDSVMGIADMQYGNVQIYDIGIAFSKKVGEEDVHRLKEQTGYRLERVACIHEESVELDFGGRTKSLYLEIPENAEEIEGFIDLHTEAGEKIPYPSAGEAVLTAKAAENMGIKAGDKVTLRDGSQNKITVTVSALCENFVSNYIYMGKETYEEQLGKEPEYKSAYAIVAEGEDLYAAAAAVSDQANVLSVSLTKDMRDRINSMMESMDYIVALIIACAGSLAFIVLYNLTNINITERIREIATIKVLGFYARETADYVFRENLMLTGMGAAAGLWLGKWLHRFVMFHVNIDTVSFKTLIKPASYIWSILFTFGFALIVNGVMYFKLEKINMAESLKSIE